MQFSAIIYILILFEITTVYADFIKYNGYAINITKLDDTEEQTNLTNIKHIKEAKNLMGIVRNIVNNKPILKVTTEKEPETSGYLTSKNYPDPYDANSGITFSKSFGEPYGVDVYIEDFDLDGAAGDYLLVKSGKSMEDEGNGLILTYTISTPKHIKILNSDSVFIEFVVQKRKDGVKISNTGFKIKWERNGEILLTTEPPSTTERLPTDDDGHKPEIIKYLAETPHKFLTHSEIFEDMLVEMANLFCANQSIILEKPVTRTNVLINQISNCPMVWPDFSDCVAVNFSIPVFLDYSVPQTRQLNDEDSEEEIRRYELTGLSMETMWSMYGEKMLKKYNFTAFKVPNDVKIMWIWQGVIILVLLLFLSFLYAVWKHLWCFKTVEASISKEDIIESMRRTSDSSDISVYTANHIVVPPLYDKELLNNGLYEPEWLVSNDKNDDNFDDEVDIRPPPPRKNSEESTEQRRFVPRVRRAISFADEDTNIS